MSEATDLKPCPFCGGEASKRLFFGCKYRVHCDVCDAHLGDVRDTEAEAIEAWNTRATPGSSKLTAEQVRVAIERNFGKVAVVDDGGETVEWRDGWTCNVGCDFKAITDELNATLGSGTCHAILNESKTDVVCSACGSSEVLRGWEEFHDWDGTRRIRTFTTTNYCPDCGRKVVDE